MNQQLAVRATNGKAVGNAAAMNDPLAGIPEWLRYLIGAYSTSKTTPGQLAVMEDLFSPFDPGLLYEAARDFVWNDKREIRNFPVAPDFRPAVERVQARHDEAAQNRAVNAFGEWFDGCQVLRVRRLDVLEDWYAGAVDSLAVSQLAGEMEMAGMEFAAAALRRRV